MKIWKDGVEEKIKTSIECLLIVLKVVKNSPCRTGYEEQLRKM